MKKIFSISFGMIGAFMTVLYGQPGVPAKTTSSVDKGKIVYEQNCLVCHQTDGSGVQNLNPPLIKTKWVSGDKKVLISILLNGMDEEIEVDGDVYNNVMPPFSYLSDQEIADVLSYVRNNFSNRETIVTSEEVRKVRSNME